MRHIKSLAGIGAIVGIIALGLGGCGGRPSVPETEEAVSASRAPWDDYDEEGRFVGDTSRRIDRETRRQLALDAAGATEADIDSVAGPGNDREEEGGEEHAVSVARDSVRPELVRPFTGRKRYERVAKLAEVFNDSNRNQYAVAERLGIKPIVSLPDAYYLRRPLVEIGTCQWYDMDTLTYSLPLLVPEAAQLLETIGRNFADSLKRRDAEGHKFRVTSVLRTASSVKRLRRVNRNATDSSTHQFGTTFDISYASFNYYGHDRRLTDEELKYILAEVLLDLREEQKCMVKYERHSPCYHITATGR